MYRVNLLALSAMVCLVGCYGQEPNRVLNVYELNKTPIVKNSGQTPEQPTANPAEAIQDPYIAESESPPPAFAEVTPPAPAAPAAPVEAIAGELPLVPPAPDREPAPAEPSETDLAINPAPAAEPADIRPSLPGETTEYFRPELPGVPGETVGGESTAIPEETEAHPEPTPPTPPVVAVEPPAAPAATPETPVPADAAPNNDSGEPAEPIAQPNQNPTPALPIDQTSELRLWVDSTGLLRIKARFIRFDNEIAVMESATGDELRIPLKRLSRGDQQFLQRIRRGDFGI